MVYITGSMNFLFGTPKSITHAEGVKAVMEHDYEMDPKERDIMHRALYASVRVIDDGDRHRQPLGPGD